MSFSVLTQQIQDCTGAVVSPITGATNIDGRTGFFQITVQQDQGFNIDAVGFNVTATRTLGPPTQIIQNGVFVNGFTGTGGVGSNFASIQLFISSQGHPPLLPYGVSFATPYSLWESNESVTLHFECTSTPAAESFSQDFTFTTGDKAFPGLTANNPANGATNVPLNQVVTMSIRDDSAGDGINGANLVLQVDPGQGSYETVYDSTMGGFQAPYNAGSTITPVGNGFDFSITRTGGWLPFTGFGVTFQFTTLRDLATPPNVADGFASFGFTQVAIPGMTFQPNPIAGTAVYPPTMQATTGGSGNGYFDITETGAGLGNPVIENLSYQINGAGPSYPIVTAGVINPGWSVFYTNPGSQVTRTSLSLNGVIPGVPAIGDTLNFTVFADIPGNDPGHTFTWNWVLGGQIQYSTTPVNGAINQPQNVTMVVDFANQVEDGFWNFTKFQNIYATINGGPQQLVYTSTGQAVRNQFDPIGGASSVVWLGSVTDQSGNTADPFNTLQGLHQFTISMFFLFDENIENVDPLPQDFLWESDTFEILTYDNTGKTGFTIDISPVFANPAAFWRWPNGIDRFIRGFWHHLVLVVDTDQALNTDRLRVYLDGNDITSEGIFAGVNWAPAAANVLQTQLGVDAFSPGSGAVQLDEVAVWAGTAFTPSQVTELGNIVVDLNSGSFTFPLPTHWWRFEGNYTDSGSANRTAVPSSAPLPVPTFVDGAGAINGGGFQTGWAVNSNHNFIGYPTLDVIFNLIPDVVYPLGAHVCFTFDIATAPTHIPVAAPGPVCFDVTSSGGGGAGGPLRVSGNATGPIDGGTDLLLLGAVLNTTPCSDDFTSGAINGAFWNQILVGSGTNVPIIEDHAIRFDTGQTPGSVAGLSTKATFGNVDVEADFVPMRQLVRANGVAVIAALGLVVTPGNAEFRLQVEANLTGYQLRILVLLAGQTLVSQTQSIRASTLGQLGTITLRLLRFGARTIGLLNGTKVVDLGWTVAPVYSAIFVSNDPTLPTQAVTEATGYRRNPQITLGTEPVVDFAIRALAAATVQVRTPAVPVPAVVDILVQGCTTLDSVVQGFTYVIGNRLIVEEDPETQLTVLNDVALKET